MKIMMVVVLYVGASFHLFFWSWMFSECGKFMVVVVLYVRASSHLFFWYGARVRGARAVCVQCARTVRVQCMRTGHTYGVYARDIHPQRVPEERASGRRPGVFQSYGRRLWAYSRVMAGAPGRLPELWQAQARETKIMLTSIFLKPGPRFGGIFQSER